MKQLYIIASAAMALGCMASANAETVITQAPAGKVIQYSYAADCLSLINYKTEAFKDAGAVGEIVITDNNEVYMKNLCFPYSSYSFSSAPDAYTDSYVKGTLKDNVITFNFPQCVREERWTGPNGGGVDYNYVNMCKRTSGTGADADYVKVDTEENVLQLKYEDGKISWMGPDDGSLILGCTSETQWARNGVYNFEAVPFDDKLVEAPANLQTTDYELLSNGEVRTVKVAFDNNNVYLRDLSDYAKDAWVKGTVDGNKITFDKNQYMGINSTFRHHVYFMPAQPVTVEVDGKKQFMLDVADKMEFSFNTDTKSFQSSYVIAINGNKEFIRYFNAYTDPMFRIPKTEVESLVPSNPVIMSWYDLDPLYGPFTGVGSITFTLPVLSVKDDVLDTSKMFYRIFVGEEPWEFSTVEYTGLKENLIDIPYSQNDSFDFIANGTYHMVYLYFHEPESIGVQSIYLDNGDQYESDVVYYDMSKVEKINTDARVVEETFHDLNGVRVDNPANGLFIRRCVMSDGSVRSQKVVKK